MHIDVIESVEPLLPLKSNWERVYDSDPEAQFFLSWDWMIAWVRSLTNPWFILAAKPTAAASDYVAIFPLRLRTKEKAGGGFYNEINMAGNFGADYTGFLCAPEFQDDAIAAFAKYIRTLHWTRLNLENLYTSRERLRLFLDHFPNSRFETVALDRVNKRDNINNCICPRVTLPDNWETYLNSSLSANTRQKLRRVLRQIEANGEFRITQSDANTVDRDLKLLLRFWETKWSARKGDRTRTIMNSNYAMLTRCFEANALFLPVLWKGDTPLGALATLIDHSKRSLLFFIAGRDETCNSPPPGLVLHAHSIRYAIDNGFKTYDFLRGNEPYKYSFGPQDYHIKCLVLSTRNRRNLGDRLDPRSIPMVVRRVTELHKAGRLAEAERGYRQILDAEPRNATALYCLGQLMASKGNHGAAKQLFKMLVTVKPQSLKAWLALGHSLRARLRFSEAADAYRQAAALKPDFTPAHINLANALVKIGQVDEAITAFEQARALQPNCAEAEIGLANALYAAGRLPPDRRAHYAALTADLGDKIRQSGAISSAIDCYRLAINLKPDLAEAHRKLGLAFQVQGDIARAAQSYRKALELDPAHADAAALLGELSRPPKQATKPVAHTSR